MMFEFNDGGRAHAGYKGDTRDCVTRAIAIATGMRYQSVYDELNLLARNERKGKRKSKSGVSNARTGVYTPTIHKFLTAHGWVWTPTMKIGQGCKVHMRANELPPGVVIVKLSKHVATVIDGVVHDTEDPSRGGSRCVYGYWQKAIQPDISI